MSRLKLREASIELRLNCSVFACFLVGIIADFSDRKEDDVCYKFLLIFAFFLNLELKYMQTCRFK